MCETLDAMRDVSSDESIMKDGEKVETPYLKAFSTKVISSMGGTGIASSST